ncbi:MAG: Tn3 family transposase [Candidatus Nanopelagicales bacterium]
MVAGADLGAVPQRRVRELARDGMVRNATALRRRRPHDKRLATLLTAVVHLRARATDDALELFDVIMTNELLARAERASTAEKARRYPRLSRDAGRLAAAVAVLLEAGSWGDGVTLDLIWEAIEKVVPRADLRASVATVTGMVPPPDADLDGQWRVALSKRYPLVRRFLPLMARTIEFDATADAARLLAAFDALPGLLAAAPTRRIPPGYLDERRIEAVVVTAGWRALVRPAGRPPGTVDRNAYLFCVLEQFHQRLKRRDIFSTASSRWADPRSQLLSGQVWEARREGLLDSLLLPEDPDGLLEGCALELDAAWRYAAARAAAGDLRVDARGRLHAAAVEAIADPATLKDLRERCQSMIPRVDIGELLLEVMSWQPGLPAAYTHLSGGGARVGGLHVTLAAVLAAQALNVGWGPVVSPGVEALTRSRISHVYQNYVRPECHAAANAALIAGQAGIATAAVWGGGLVAAVDGTRFVVPVRSVDARPNPKYFGRRKGATWLNMVNDHGAGIAGMVLSGTPRDTLHAVDLMYRRDGGARPEVFISDTGSYSDMVFGLLKLLGVAYRPELADLPDQKLWRTDPGADYGPVDTASRGRIDLAKVERHWADITRVAASVHAGEVSAHDVMLVLQRGGSPTQLGDALAHFGRIFKTLHVLAFIDAEPYRRGIKRMRNLQEERHGLAKHVFHGRRGELREPYHAGMEDQLGALGLVINAITLWNTVYLDRILARLRADGLPVLDEDVTRLHPYWYKHINVHGHYAFYPPTPGGEIGSRPLRDPDRPDDDDR